MFQPADRLFRADLNEFRQPPVSLAKDIRGKRAARFVAMERNRFLAGVQCTVPVP